MKRLILLLCFVMLVSCESRDDKYSRLTIDLYANKISSILGNIAEIKAEEETRTQQTLDDFYSVYVTKVEEFIKDLNLEEISPLYMAFKDSLLLAAEDLNCYLNYREDAVVNMINAFSFYESASKSKSDSEEYVILKNSSYSESDYYSDLISKSLEEYKAKTQEFNTSKRSYLKNIQKMDSIYFLMDSIVVVYNQKVVGSKLEDKITVPLTFRDTINDWLLSSKFYLQELVVHKPGL